MTRERFLLSGDSGTGKTLALFSLIEEILYDHTSTVFFLDCDSGAERFINRVSEFANERFFYFPATDWIETRKAYREVKRQWKTGDWLFIDRADLIWDDIQNYYNALVAEVSEDDLDQKYLDARIGKRKGETVHKDKPPEREIGGTDWGPIKDAYNSIVYDAYNGPESRMKTINVVMTTLAVSQAVKYKPEGAKSDARDLTAFGVAIQGEKNLPSLPDTHLLLRKTPTGYTATTVKDRERKILLLNDIVDPFANKPLHRVYQAKVGVEFLGQV